MAQHSAPVEQILEVFPWSEQLETHIAVIDEQHKRLIKLLNCLAAVPTQNEMCRGALNNTFDELIEYSRYHFETEEALWHPYFESDPSFTEHQHLHNDFLTEVRQIRQQGDHREPERVVDQLLKFLIRWLAFHILDSDKRMALTVRAIEAGSLMEEARDQADREVGGSLLLFTETMLKMYETMSASTLALLREKRKRKALEQALQASEARERRFSGAIMKAMPGLIVLYDEQFQVSRWNWHYVEVTGHDGEEPGNNNLFDVTAERDHATLIEGAAALKEATKKSEEKRAEETSEGASSSIDRIHQEISIINRTQQQTPYLFSTVPLQFKGGQHFLASGVDISDLKFAEHNLEQALLGIVTAVSKAIEVRDPYTAGHQQNVAEIAVAIGEQIGMDAYRLEGLRLGASIHDIGKLAVPVELLSKPCKLSEIEYALIQTHASAGGEILGGIEFPWPIIEIATQHHERIDGSGYPNSLKGEEIILEARIVAVADVYESMATHRPYRASLGQKPAIDEITAGRGHHYDAEIVDALLDLIRMGRPWTDENLLKEKI